MAACPLTKAHRAASQPITAPLHLLDPIWACTAGNSMDDELTWEATFAIARALRRSHPDANLDDLSLGTIYRWTLELPGFQDDPALANDSILMAIYQEWLEEQIPHE